MQRILSRGRRKFSRKCRSWDTEIGSSLSIRHTRCRPLRALKPWMTGTDQLTVVREVLRSIAQSEHVRPVVFMDAELPFVTEQQAPGVIKFRGEIKAALGDLPVHSVLHEQLIQQMNQTSNSFHILILKTTLTIPYTSVFLRLDCRYWSDAAEQELRQEMKNRGSAASDIGVQ